MMPESSGQFHPKYNHVRSVKDAIQSFLWENHGQVELNSFQKLVQFMSQRFITVDQEMFKGWVEKEFPGQFNFEE